MGLMNVATAVIAFRPLTHHDLPMLHEWLSRPHVAEWWGEPGSLSDVEREYGPLLHGQGTTHPYVALADHLPIGYIQSYVAMGSGDGWWPEVRDPGVRGIDQFLADDAQLGRGLGTLMVRAFVTRLFSNPGVTLVQVDPSPDNARAIRSYEKAGFQAVGEVHTPGGPALLMHCHSTIVRPQAQTPRLRSG